MEESRQFYSKLSLEDKSSFIYSDGFSAIPRELPSSFEVIIVLAGLGTTKMVLILSSFPREWTQKKLWLLCLPHTCPLKLLDWAKRNNWALKKESYFQSRGRIYPILLFFNAQEKELKTQEDSAWDDLYWTYWDYYFQLYSKLESSKRDRVTQEWLQEYAAKKALVSQKS